VTDDGAVVCRFENMSEAVKKAKLMSVVDSILLVCFG